MPRTTFKVYRGPGYPVDPKRQAEREFGNRMALIDSLVRHNPPTVDYRTMLQTQLDIAMMNATSRTFRRSPLLVEKSGSITHRKCVKIG